MQFLECCSDAIVNRTVDELIGAMFLAVAVALVMAGAYALHRRKSPPTPTFVGTLALVSGLLGMAVAVGYIEYAETVAINGGVPSFNLADSKKGGMVPGPKMLPWNYFWAGRSSGFHVVVAADRNHDGRLTPDEVALMVRKADRDGDGSVDFHDIDQLLASRFRFPFQPPDFRGPDHDDVEAPNGSWEWLDDAGDGHLPDEDTDSPRKSEQDADPSTAPVD